MKTLRKRQLGTGREQKLTHVMEGIKIIFPILGRLQINQRMNIMLRNQRMYQSIRSSFSFIVPGGAFRFMKSATMTMTMAVKGRFM